MRIVLRGLAVALTMGWAPSAIASPSWTQTGFLNSNQPAGCGWTSKVISPIGDGQARLAVFADDTKFALIFISDSLPAKSAKVGASELVFGQIARSPDRVSIISDGLVAAIWSKTKAPIEDFGGASSASIAFVADGKRHSFNAEILDGSEIISQIETCRTSPGTGFTLTAADAPVVRAWLNNKKTAENESPDTPTISIRDGRRVLSYSTVSATGSVSAGVSGSASAKATTGSTDEEDDKEAGKTGATDDLSGSELFAALQSELYRLGCYTGRIDGKWGKGSRRAVRLYAKHSGADAARPDTGLLASLKTDTGRVCPLTCGRREVERDGRCVTKRCSGGKVLDRKGRCRTPSAREYRRNPDRPRERRTATRRRGGGCGRIANGRMCWRASQDFFATYRCSSGRLSLINTTRNASYATKFPHC